MLHGETADSCGCSHGAAAKKVLGDVTSLNLTVLKSGVEGEVQALNVIPSVAEATFDIRISPHMEPSDMSQRIDQWCRECSASSDVGLIGSFNVEQNPSGATFGPSLQWEYVINRGQEHHVTSTDPAVNPWWPVFLSGLGATADVDPLVFPAATDSRFLRAVGIRAFGFSPMRRSPVLLHEHNEYIEESVFLEGCDIYYNLLMVLGLQNKFVGDTLF